MLHRSHKLLVGVPSYGAPLALSRRQHIRNLSGARSLSHGARLVFVLPEDDAHAEDGGWADVWRVPLPAAAERRARHNYGLEKWLLCDAFLRRAVRERAGFDFYALADDDTLFNLTTLHARLHPFAAAPQAHLVFGSVEECASHAARYGSKPRLAEQRPVPVLRPSALHWGRVHVASGRDDLGVLCVLGATVGGGAPHARPGRRQRRGAASQAPRVRERGKRRTLPVRALTSFQPQTPRP